MRQFLFAIAVISLAGCSAVSDFGFTFGDASTDGGSAEGGGGEGGVDGGVQCASTCDDGNPCNGLEQCDTTIGSCMPGTPVMCPAADPCHGAGTCDPTSGMCVPGLPVAVDDHDPCNGVEACVASGSTYTITHSGDRCDDHVDCTTDQCDMVSGACTNTPRDADCPGMNDLCLVTPATCDAATTCVMDGDCTTPGDHCFGGNCCSMLAMGMCLTRACTTDAMCDDGHACNGAETCDGVTSTCDSGTPPACDDGLDCSADSCSETGAMCRHTAPDVDGDGFISSTCVTGTGDDCDDAEATVHPGATDVCDGVDQNCNGTPDENYISGPTGVGMPCSNGTGACLRSGMYVCNAARTGTACDAMAGTPAAMEVCGNGVDENCNGMLDDGYPIGMPCTVGTGACTSMGTYVCATTGLAVDCNTGAGMPGTELCHNMADDDCDGMTDEGFEMWGAACTAGVGPCLANGTYVCTTDNLHLTCNAVPGTGTTEVCNGLDDDCNGSIDDGRATNWWRDGDGDGFGDPTSVTFAFCQPTGYVNNNQDCNDANNMVRPGATEVCGNGLDDNCNTMMDEGCGPANDLCSSPHSIGPGLRPFNSGTWTQTMDYANGDMRDCTAPSGTSSGPEVFFTFDVAPMQPPMIVYFDTFGTTFDTMISIRNNCGSSPLQCDDDATACGVLQTQTVFSTPMSGSAGLHYVLAVHAFFTIGTMPSTIVLNWQTLPQGTGFTGRLPTTTIPGSVTQAYPGGTVGGSGCGCAAGAASNPDDMWYVTGCPGVAHTLRVDTCSSTPSTWNSVLYVKAGTSMTDVACNDEGGGTCTPRSNVAASISGAGIWGLYVDRAGGLPPSGNYTLSITSF